ncbi:hypothetical protein GGX14DRAFT_567102 [Mycena pura]|uniref:Uncharacterized protein n=1 Tax=Mycena pura TaxID=153505 RepID=A0AAD6VJ19_9AGAR|nr:hypothetical protein GGX14DRAFT_567102 [Mycena pura]
MYMNWVHESDVREKGFTGTVEHLQSGSTVVDHEHAILSLLAQVDSKSPCLTTVSFRIILGSGYRDIQWEQIDARLTTEAFARLDRVELCIFKPTLEQRLLGPPLYEKPALRLEDYLTIEEFWQQEHVGFPMLCQLERTAYEMAVRHLEDRMILLQTRGLLRFVDANRDAWAAPHVLTLSIIPGRPRHPARLVRSFRTSSGDGLAAVDLPLHCLDIDPSPITRAVTGAQYQEEEKEDV